MSPKVIRFLWLSDRGEQVRTADRPERVAKESFRDTVLRRRTGIANRNIGVVSTQVYNAVCADHIEGCVGTQFSPAWQAWHEPTAGKGVGCCHAKGLSIAVAPNCSKSAGKRIEPIADDRKQASA